MLQDEKNIDTQSDRSVLGALTGFGVETGEGARACLQQLYRHAFENGPPPTVPRVSVRNLSPPPAKAPGSPSLIRWRRHSPIRPPARYCGRA